MIAFAVAVLGLAVGSFVNALVWRLHEQTKKKSKFSKTELSITKGRSLCVHCGHHLGVKDLLPVISWCLLKGKCRYCHKPISWQYPLVELATALLFAVSYLAWPSSLTTGLQTLEFVAFLAFATLAVALSLNDVKWMLLPNRLVYPLGLVAGALAVLASIRVESLSPLISGVVGSIGLGGLFYLLYQISKGSWIGGGDVRLGFTIGLALGWQRTLLSITISAYLALVLVLVLLLMGKYHKRMRLPFGPFLLLGALLTSLWGQRVVDWYLKISGLSG